MRFDRFVCLCDRLLYFFFKSKKRRDRNSVVATSTSYWYWLATVALRWSPLLFASQLIQKQHFLTKGQFPGKRKNQNAFLSFIQGKVEIFLEQWEVAFLSPRNFRKFCWVIRTQPLTVLKLFLLYLILLWYISDIYNDIINYF